MSIGRAIKGLRKATKLLITPRVEAFLRDYPDGARFDADTYQLMHDITQAWVANDARAGRWGASSRGKCLRRQVFGFLGMPGGGLIDPDLQNLFNDGKWRHMRWQIMAIEAGALTHAEYPYEHKGLRLSGRMDGLNSYESFGFELKGDRSMSRILDSGIPVEHNLQIHSMLLATGWDRFSYIMEDKGAQTWREFVVERDPVTIREVRKELETLNEHVENRTLPKVLPACVQKQGPYRQCPFGYFCLERRKVYGDHWPTVPGDWDS